MALLVSLSLTEQCLAAATIQIDSDTTLINLAQQVDYLSNPEQKTLIDIINSPANHEFRPVDLSSHRQLAELDKSFFLRFSVTNNSAQTVELWLAANAGTISQLNVYQLLDEGQLASINNVDYYHSLLSQPLKKLLFPPRSTQFFYISAHATSPHSFNIQLMQPQIFLNNATMTSYSFSIALGILLTLLLANLFMALFFSSATFLYHGCMLLATASICLISMRIPTLLFNDFSEWRNTATVTLFCLATLSAQMCTRAFIKQTGKYNPFLKWLSFGIIFNIGYSLISISFTHEHPFLMLVPFAMALTIEILALTDSARRHKDPVAAYLATSIFFVFLIFLLVSINKSITFSIDMLIDPVLLYASIAQSLLVTTLFFIRQQQLDKLATQDQLSSNIDTLQRDAKKEILEVFNNEIQKPLSDILDTTNILSTLPSLNMTQLNTIRNQTQLLVNKIAEIDYAVKLEQHIVSVRRSPFELRIRLERWIKHFQAIANKKFIELTIDIQPDVPDTVVSDEYRLRQIITLLMEGAINRTEQGQISLKVLRTDSNKNIFHFIIADTGSFITDTEDNKHQQTADAFLHELGSALLIDSMQGQGTSCEFFMEMEVIEETSTNGIIDTLNKKRLLIADDNATTSQILLQQTRRWGLRVDAVQSGQEAIGRHKYKTSIGEPYDIVILDYDMPKMNGIEVAEHIRHSTENKPFMILLVGSYQAPSEQLSQLAGIDIIIDKPVPQKLLSLTLTNFFLEKQKHVNEKSRKMKVLVTDDDDTQRFVISKMLDGFGMQYELASDGLLATEQIKREKFDIILMDCEMPRMNGFEAAVKIHQWQTSRQEPLTPIIALTAFTLNEYKERSQSAGMSDYLEKPIDKHELLAMLHRHAK